MDKAQLRRKLQNCVLAMAPKERSEKSRKACQNLISIPEFQNASTLMMFLSLPHEVDTSEAILCAWQLGKTVAVPKISWQQRHMIPVQISSLETGLSTAASGLRSPTAGVPIPFDQIDLVVTPALGFDREGNRLGRGGSFYDRFFANEELKAVRCGFAFSEQVIDSVPMSESDEPVDMLVTDKEVLYLKDEKGE
jgi:5-formyltetrahydrofolate cyclo-ligase